MTRADRVDNDPCDASGIIYGGFLYSSTVFFKLCSAEPLGSAEPCLGFCGMTAALFISCTLQANLPQRGSAVRMHSIAQCTLYND